MVLDFGESRVTNPVKLVDWGTVEESQGVVCGCCGWAGRLGECAQASADDARIYACVNCEMTLVARAYPRTFPLRAVAHARTWRASDLLAANF